MLRYAEARLASINRQEQTAEMSGTHVAEGTGDDFEGKGESFVSFTTVDRLGVLKDLFEKEVELREACRKYMDTLLLAYDNTVHMNERELLAAEILDAMRARPSHENQMHRPGEQPSYFRASYDMLIAKFNSKERLVAQMVHMQVQAERRVTSPGAAVFCVCIPRLGPSLGPLFFSTALR